MIFLKPRFFGFFVFIFLLVLSQYLTYQRYLLNKRTEQYAITNAIKTAKERLNSTLNSSLAATSTLRFIIENYGEPQNFDSVAIQLLKTSQFIDAIQLVKGAVITHVYPLKGNEDVIGHNLLSDSVHNKEAIKAIEKKQLYFSGPFELIQGGLGVVGRLPIFKEDTFWGFAAVIIRLPTLLKAAGLNIEKDHLFDYQLSKINPNTQQEEFFLPQHPKFNKENSTIVNVPDGEWNLMTQSKKPFMLSDLWPFIALGVLLSAISGWFAWYFAKQPYKLEKLIFKRTKELKISEEKYRSLVEQASDGIIQGDEKGNITLVNTAICRMLGYSKDELMMQKVEDTYPETTKELAQQLKEQAFEKGELYFERMMMRKDGTEMPAEISVAKIGSDKLLGIVRDITDRKKSEAALRESEERYRILIQNSPYCILEIDQQGKLISMNQSGLEMMCLSSEEDIPGKEYLDSVGEKDKKRIDHLLQLALKGQYAEFEFETNNKLHFQSSFVPIRDELGRVQRLMGITQDITERKKTESLLKYEKERTITILNFVSSPIFLKDNDHRIIFANYAFFDLFGLDECSVIGKTLGENVPENEMKHIQEVDRNVLDTGIPYIKEEELTIKGFTHTIITEKKRLIDAFDNKFLVCTIHNITQRKEFENKLLESKNYLKSIYDTVDDIIFHLKVEPNNFYRFLSVNKSFCSTTGLSEEMVIGKLINDILPKQSLSLVLKKYKQAILEKSVVKWEETTEYPTGKLIGQVSIVPVFDDFGNCTHMVGSVHDITYRKQAEEEVIKLNRTLEQKVIQRTSQLEVANKDLEAFSYSVSHDLRSPLRHINGYSEILTKQYSNHLPEKALEHLNKIIGGAQKMGTLIDDLLNFSRTGRIELKRTKIKMNQVIEDVLVQTAPSFQNRKIDWDVLPLPEVLGDYNLLRMVWVNLVENAIKYTKNKEKAVIQISFKEEKSEYIFYIKDNGVGFDMQYADKLFGVFQRLHSASQFDGTGIGLANVKSIILRHGGRTWAKAESDKGATFYFSIPKEVKDKQ